LGVSWLVWLAACSRQEPPRADLEPLLGAQAALVRLTEDEWRNSAEDLLGVRWEGDLPTDYRLEEFSRIGGSELTIPPMDLEQYETATWSIARSALAELEDVHEALGCSSEDLVCVRAFAARFGRRAWRRPLSSTELDRLLSLYDGLEREHDAVLGLEALVSAVLLSPEFLFHVELGAQDSEGVRRLTPFEVAGRLSSFLTRTVPDEPLLEAAEQGTLLRTDVLLAHTERLLETPRGRAATLAFFSEMFELHELETVAKDPALYPVWTEGLREEMVEEMEDLFGEIALSEDRALGELLTASRAELGPRLQSLYGSSLPERGGALGRAAFLAVQSHNASTSPTYRGKFVASKLLCEQVPPPPDGVVFDLEVMEGGTLRDRLEQHAIDPACMGCHVVIDPPGYALEHFDPIGQWRALDNGLPIDATGEIAGVPFDGAVELGHVVADDPRFASCMVSQLLHYSTARASRPEDELAIRRLTRGWLRQDQVFLALVREIVTSEAFLTLAGPTGESCEQEGASRSCATACGAGLERCVSGTWQGCTAPPEPLETCNGADDDCDGELDEALERPCASEPDSRPIGTQRCAEGAWGECAVSTELVEVCNSEDDDRDGGIDEGYGVAVRSFPLLELARFEPSCDLAVDPSPQACARGLTELCASTGCAVAGLGPVQLGVTELEVVCLGEEQAVVLPTSFEELGALEEKCVQDTFFGRCFPAAHALCDSRGLRTGYGAVTNADGEVSAVCTPGASVFEVTYGELEVHDLACDGFGFGAESPLGCLHASASWCQAQGFETGYGPVAYLEESVQVACLEEAP
jgi:hypothetical protein